jgi:hypothetical protein
VRVAFHDVAASCVEAYLARGGEGSHRLVEEAWRRGARFDGWSEHFRWDVWADAAAALSLDLTAAGLPAAGPLPWKLAVQAGLDPDFLQAEAERGRRGELTPDCRDGSCAACGVCAGDVQMDVLA